MPKRSVMLAVFLWVCLLVSLPFHFKKHQWHMEKAGYEISYQYKGIFHVCHLLNTSILFLCTKSQWLWACHSCLPLKLSISLEAWTVQVCRIVMCWFYYYDGKHVEYCLRRCWHLKSEPKNTRYMCKELPLQHLSSGHFIVSTEQRINLAVGTREYFYLSQ